MDEWISVKDKSPSFDQRQILVFCEFCKSCHTVAQEGGSWALVEYCHPSKKLANLTLEYCYSVDQEIPFKYWMPLPKEPCTDHPKIPPGTYGQNATLDENGILTFEDGRKYDLNKCVCLPEMPLSEETK